MIDTFSNYWPHILFVISLALGVPAAIHATMTKEEVRSALGWVGIIVLSPVVGAVIYAIAGINLMRRATLNMQRDGLPAGPRHVMAGASPTDEQIHQQFSGAFTAMKRLGDTVSRYKLTSGNSIHMLKSGDEAYAAMLEAIAASTRSILLETYIFDRDAIGTRFVEALVEAKRRGVDVRILIDAVGARYSMPSIVGLLRDSGLSVKVFNGNIIMGLRLPYANLRTHRKIMVVDGEMAFTGGMNIRSGFSSEFAGNSSAYDTHFHVSGPLVADLFQTASEDWRFSGGEPLEGDAWRTVLRDPEPGILARVVPSGPDKSIESNHRMMMGAFSVAKSHIRIMSPYFLPDRELISALVTAARRGVDIDIAVPSANNLRLVDSAMTAQFDQLLKYGCRIWRTHGRFNHSKLMVVDGTWSYIGSSNLDPRSLRLNFEVDIEVLDTGFSEMIESRILAALDGALPVELDKLRARPFVQRLAERVVWLGSPYL
ncbi:phospholipase D-like domain-containing protein [Pararhizobium sp.]|uniref:phospholipase D-like domain-containing protein n=1 Tax=Pararhizobium sp. TaxID=1977563 RepID=UPI0027233D75|nr:phospholipase D-like domain-containing protein [Pararhizobium sp.]MDO9417821.1 phospholipase D-like domain-containing protein [Pararhizobium sp.]